jgi:hypothetical protein
MDSLDPDKLALVRERVKSFPLSAQRKAPRHKPGEKFLRGPIPMRWVNCAAQLPGKALHVGIILWHLAGLKHQAGTVTLSSAPLEAMGIKRTTGYRALAVLETAGLISVKRRPGCAPVVTLLDGTVDT